MRRIVAVAALLLTTLQAHAGGHVLRGVKLDIFAPGAQQIIPAALIGMDDVMDECTQRVGIIRVEGVQFSESGATLNSFRFTDRGGIQWSVPTGIEHLPTSERAAANSLIRVGKRYLVHFEVCGSGGFPSLVALYDVEYLR